MESENLTDDEVQQSYAWPKYHRKNCSMNNGCVCAEVGYSILVRHARALEAKLAEEAENYKINNLTWLEAREARLKSEARTVELESCVNGVERVLKNWMDRSIAHTDRIKELEAQIATINSRIAQDSLSYERDQYLIARLREQLAELARRTR